MGKDKKGGKDMFFVNLGMAGISAGISKTACAPMERVKLVIQTQDSNPNILVKYKGIGDCFARISKEEGVKTFWNGNLPNIIRYMPTQAFNLAFKDKYKMYFTGHLDKKKDKLKFAVGSIAAGGFAGMTSYPVTYPFDYVRTKLSTQTKNKKTGKKQYSGIMDCFKQSIKADGITSIYKGYAIANVGIFTYRGLQFGIYDIEKQYIAARFDIQNPILSRLFNTALSFTAVNISAFGSYPIETVRRRLMMDVGKAEKEFSGTLDCFRKILKNEGMNGLYRGAAANVFRALGATLVLVIYDDAKKFAYRKLGY